MAESVRVGDTGTILTKTVSDNGVVVDLSGATVKNLVVTMDGVSTTLAGTFATDGTDGVLNFTSVAGTWPTRGVAKEQVQYTDSSGSWSCVTELRDVEAKL